MACRFEEEFNPWPSFVDIFSSVILVLLLFLLVVLANLGYYAQFKYKVSVTGSISTDELILKTPTATEHTTNAIPVSGSDLKPNSNLNIQVYKEEKQMVLALQNQITADEAHVKSAEGFDDVESPGINVADKKEDLTKVQDVLLADEYFIITYKADELFIDDVTSKKLKDFLNKSKSKYPNHQVAIYSADMKNSLSATIAKQVSLARTMSTRNLIKKFGYDRKDVKIDLATFPEIKEEVKADNGYILIKIVK